VKALKFDHELAEQIRSGQKTSTWRLFDDKSLSVNDEVRLIDKVNPDDPESWKVIGVGMITEVIEKQLGDIELAGSDMDGHEAFKSPNDMLVTYKGYYGNNVTFQTPVKLIHFKLLPTSAEGDTTEVKPGGSKITALKIYTDGGSRGNPGPSASGYVLIDAATDKVIVDKGIYLGITTNNQAEYQALKFALEEAHKMGAERIDVYMDSMLVVNQMKGIFKVKNRELWAVHDAITTLRSSFKHITFTHVPRAMNSLADNAVNRALDEELGIGAGS
jgi:ribonuclease HI